VRRRALPIGPADGHCTTEAEQRERRAHLVRVKVRG
jgi:hypothetical protein